MKSNTDLKDSNGKTIVSVNKGNKVSVISVGSNKSKVAVGKHIGYVDNHEIGEQSNQGVITVHDKLPNTVVSRTNNLPKISINNEIKDNSVNNETKNDSTNIKKLIKDNSTNNNNITNNNNTTNNQSTTYYIANLNNGMSLNVRQQPSTSSQVIGSLDNGDTVNVISKTGDWQQISNGSTDTSNNNYQGSYSQGNSFNMQSFRNYINSENANNYTNTYTGILSPENSTKWAFVQVNHFRPVNVQKMNEILSNAGVLRGQGEAIVKAAKKWNLDPVYLMAQTILETGWGHSELAEGATIDRIADFNHPIYNGAGNLVGYRMESVPPTTVYNLYGIGAFDSAPYLGGTSYAYTHGWTSIASALDGAAQFISENYVNSPKYQQNTPYKLRYPANSEYSWHAYATAPNYGSQIGTLMSEFRGCYLPSDNITYSYPSN